MTERVLPLAGIHNFRDYGGYTTAEGSKLRRQTLFRSGQHVHATPADLAAISALSLRTVIDLRGNSERAEWPCVRPEGFDAHVLYFDGETSGTGGASHGPASRKIITSADADAAMIEIYARMPFLPSLQSVLRDYFAALATRDGASLLHCFAGKDRTGLGVALLHQLLGVHTDDMMADYLLTNTAGNAEARIAAGVESIRRSQGAQISDGAIRILMSVAPEYLDSALGTLRERHGSVTSYARDVLGVDDERLAALRKRLVL
jgi:protein tyrosine/serine phosphatase